MKKRSSILLALILILSISVMCTGGALADDAPSEWARENVAEATKLGLVPQNMQSVYTNPTTREEFCDALILLLNMISSDLLKTEVVDAFSDTDNASISVLYSLGVVEGVGERRFNPNGGISRQEAATILTRAAKVLGQNESYSKTDFADSGTIAGWAEDGIDYVAGAGIMQGTGTGFEPLAEYTREQTIATILRLYKLVKLTEPKDNDSAPTASKKDLDSSWDSPNGTIILDGAAIAAEGTGVSVNGNIATITATGTYVVSGTSTDGQIVVNATKNDHVRLVLNGAHITNKSGAPIYAASCDKLVVILADGTKNTLTDGGDGFKYANETNEEPNAALFCKDDLTINGTGMLDVNAEFNNGIGTKDDLVIVSGNITVTAANHGLRGNDSVSVYGGALSITAGKDGIQSSNADDAEKGWIYIADGSITIKAENDGIQAETDMLIAGGVFEITTGGGASAAPVQQNGFGGGVGGQRPQGGMNGNQFPGGTTSSDTTATTTESKKAVKSNGNLVINGGIFVIDAEDDGVHSDNDLTVNGGDFTIQSGDDGVHATNALIITNGNIRIIKSYEGLEGSTIDISGGNIYADASDDGINAAGGVDSTGGRGGDRFSQASSHYIRITGGVVDVCGGADGIDSNGNVFLDGGTVYISGQSMGMDGAIDLDGAFTVTGGTLITAGSVISPQASSTQASLLVSYTAQNASGSIVTLKDENGSTIAEYTSRIAFGASGFTSPNLVIGQTYSIWVNNEKRIDVTLSGVVTAVAEGGGAYNIGGFGGGRGQGGGRGMNP